MYQSYRRKVTKNVLIEIYTILSQAPSASIWPLASLEELIFPVLCIKLGKGVREQRWEP